MDGKLYVIMTAIVSITVLESIALLCGVNGIVLASVMAVIVQLVNTAYGQVKKVK